MQAAAPSADSLGVGRGEAEVEVTSLSELGSQAVDALNLFIDNQDPPAAAAGAGSNSSRWAGAASSAGSGPTIFPPSVMEHEDRDLELEEPFAGPTDQEVMDDPEAIPFDSPTTEGHPAPVGEHSFGDTQMHPSLTKTVRSQGRRLRLVRTPLILQTKAILRRRSLKCSCHPKP